VKKIDPFTFIVRHFGFLKFIPLMAFQFDSMLKLWMLLTRPELLDCIDDIEAEVLSWPGAERQLHKYGGLQFNCNGKEIGHIHGNGILDMRFSRKIKAELMAAGRIDHHHVFVNSGWITFRIRERGDYLYASKLLRIGYLRVLEKPPTMSQ
jgi:hypothetical protein